jgi:AhpC/TSA family
MRAPVDTIAAPPFPPQLRWINVEGKRLRLDHLIGKPFLIEFWDFCRPNSIRTMPYIKAWHERYGGEDGGLRVVGVHSPGFEASSDRDAVIEAVKRLEIEYPVLIDSELETWREYENLGWPARYLFNAQGMLYDYHYGEGAYEETELAIQDLLFEPEAQRPRPVAPIRPEDAPGAKLAAQTEDQDGAYSGPYEAGGVWAVVSGNGILTVNGGPQNGGSELCVTAPGAYPLIEHHHHVAAVVKIEEGEGVHCLATCFTPGLA